MYQTLRIRNREKGSYSICKKHNKKDSIKRKILGSMSKESRERYLKKQKERAKKRKDIRKTSNINSHKLRIEQSRRIGKKHFYKNTHTETNTIKVSATQKNVKILDFKKTTRNDNNARQRKIKRRILKIIHYANRNGVDYMHIIKKLFLDFGLYLSDKFTQIKLIVKQLFCAGINKIPVSKYQKKYLTIHNDVRY